MQYIQDTCLISLIISSIFKGNQQRRLFNFTWDQINNPNLSFNQEYSYEDARFLLQLSLMVTDANFTGKQLELPQYFEKTVLIYTECPLPLISQGISNSSLNKPAALGYILYNKQTNFLFIIFTGTSNLCMAGLDLAYSQVELNNILNYTPGLRGHKGIYLAYNSIRSKLIQVVAKYLVQKPKIIISGHSLGGALSQLCALDLAFYDPIHYSFATPMIFNYRGYLTFTQLVKYSYRVANVSDLVVLSPLPVMPNGDAFFHVGKSLIFQRNLGNYSTNHSVAYLQEFNLP